MEKQQTQSVPGCILPAQHYRVVNTPNESWGVLSTELQAEPMSVGVYSLCTSLHKHQHTQCVLGVLSL